MFAFEVWFVDGVVVYDQGYKTFYDAESEMLEIVDNSDIGVDFWMVKEIC